MLDVALAYNRYQFLGEEFLTWLWYIIENNQSLIKKFDRDFVALEIGDRVVLENRRNENDERISIKGDGASLEEAFLALSKGAFVTELNLVYKSAELMWQFTLKGESLNISSLRSSKIALPETDDDMESYVLEKIFIYEKALQLVENLYSHFVKRRVSETWQNKETLLIGEWIRTA